jgi:hypothetical protein
MTDLLAQATLTDRADLAEFLGGAIGLSLPFGTPLLVGMVITGICCWSCKSLAFLDPPLPRPVSARGLTKT